MTRLLIALTPFAIAFWFFAVVGMLTVAEWAL
jgi:hypothetical protein